MRKIFDKLPDGTDVELLTLKNGKLSAGILTYGGTLQNLIVPDKNGNPTDVVLGYDTIADYQKNSGYIGALVGRYANRIDHAKFTMNGKEYPLYANDGINHLHGGKVGFDKKSGQWKSRPRTALHSLWSAPTAKKTIPAICRFPFPLHGQMIAHCALRIAR